MLPDRQNITMEPHGQHVLLIPHNISMVTLPRQLCDALKDLTFTTNFTSICCGDWRKHYPTAAGFD